MPCSLNDTIFALVSYDHSLGGVNPSATTSLVFALYLNLAASSPDKFTLFPPSHCNSVGTTPVVYVGAEAGGEWCNRKYVSSRATDVVLGMKGWYSNGWA